MATVLERAFRPPHPVDLRLTLAPLRRGGADPSMRIGPSGIWRATRTPGGPVTMRLWQTGPDISVQAWGPGSAWAVEAAPALTGADDNDEGFDGAAGRHPAVAAIWRRLSSVRFCRSQAVTEALVPTIIEQKVVGLDARQSYCRIVRAYGEPAPGPTGDIGPRLLLPPSAERLAGLPGWAFHRFNVERKRADTVRLACRVARRLDECVELGTATAHRRLQALPGIGAWSSAEAVRLALGDPDAVSVGDYHLPHLVTYSLAGERRGTDERMLELLEPWRGQRARVVRLLELGGTHPPRRAPRMSRQSIAAI
jgi:3-methyladenine DNA glycosylase/8-oxoguanine DNA glycosylase